MKEYRVEMWVKQVLIQQGDSLEKVSKVVKKSVDQHNAVEPEQHMFVHSIEDITENDGMPTSPDAVA